MKIAVLFHEHPSLDLDLYFQLQGLKELLTDHSIFVGPIPQWTDGRTFRLALSHYDMVFFGGLDSDERKGFLAEAAPLGIPCLPFGAVPAAYCRLSRIESLIGRPVYFAGDFEEKETVDRQVRLFHLLKKRTPTLWVAQTASVFNQSPVFGFEAFYSPRAPFLHLEAIGSASQVVSCRLTPAVLAVAKGIPAVLVSFSDEMTKVAEAFGIPVLLMGKRRSSARLRNEIEGLFSSYPWPSVTQNIGVEVGHFRKSLQLGGIDVPSFSIENETHKILTSVHSEFQMNLCVVCDEAQISMVEGFIANCLMRADLKLKFHVLELEGTVGERLKSRFKNHTIEITSIDELYSSEELSNGAIGGVRQRFLAHVLRKIGGEIFYMDPQVYFYSSPSTLLRTFTEGSIGLYPQWRSEYREARRYGLYDPSLLALRPGAERFLKWWEIQSLKIPVRDVEGRALYEQALLDFVPLYFENTRVYRGGDQVLAHWNCETLQVEYEALAEQKPRLGTGKAAHSFWAGEADTLGIYETKVGWDHLNAFFGPLFQSTRFLTEKIWNMQLRHSSVLERVAAFSDGIGRIPFLSVLNYSRMSFLLKRALGVFRFMNRFMGRREGSQGSSLWKEKPASKSSLWVESQRGILNELQEKDAA